METTPIGDLIRQRATTGDGAAFVEGVSGRSLSWPEVSAAVDAWAPLAGGGPVGLALADPLTMISATLGALGAGVMVAPLDPAAPAAELATRARRLSLASVVSDCPSPAGFLDALAAAGVERQGVPGDPQLPVGGAPATVGLVMASSGTTGVPKVIPLTHEQLLHTARGVARHLRLEPEERGFSPLPLFHINGLVVGVLAAAVAGSSLVVERRFSRQAFWQVVERHGVTWLNLVPAIISLLASGPAGPSTEPAGRVRLARSASAPLAPSVAERFTARFGIPIVESYGMTEAASQITANPLDDIRPGSVGCPVGLEVRVVGEDGTPRATGLAGGVQIRGASVVTEYWTEDSTPSRSVPATTADGWLPTGDVGRLDADGYLYLLGREDDVINRGGEKVRPREVEEVLLADPRVQAAVVVGRPHPTAGSEPVAYVLAADGIADHGRLGADLADRCQVTLSRFKRPADIIVVDDLPAGPTGKVRRAEVGRVAGAGLHGRAAHPAGTGAARRPAGAHPTGDRAGADRPVMAAPR